jgi:hypothetical protein
VAAERYEHPSATGRYSIKQTQSQTKKPGCRSRPVVSEPWCGVGGGQGGTLHSLGQGYQACGNTKTQRHAQAYADKQAGRKESGRYHLAAHGGRHKYKVAMPLHQGKDCACPGRNIFSSQSSQLLWHPPFCAYFGVHRLSKNASAAANTRCDRC